MFSQYTPSSVYASASHSRRPAHSSPLSARRCLSPLNAGWPVPRARFPTCTRDAPLQLLDTATRNLPCPEDASSTFDIPPKRYISAIHPIFASQTVSTLYIPSHSPASERASSSAMAGQQQQIFDTIFAMKKRLMRDEDCRRSPMTISPGADHSDSFGQ